MTKAPLSDDPCVAVIDLGSNSIKLLVASRGEDGSPLRVLDAKTLETRISEGISHANPRLTPAAFQAGLVSVGELYEDATKHNPAAIKLVATSMVRDAENGPEFMAAIKAKTGLQCTILSGPEEAEGIARGIACDPACQGADAFDLMDIGGGSFEFVSFQAHQPRQLVSLQLGAVRMLEICVKDPTAPVDPETAATIKTHTQTALKASGFQFNQEGAPLVATGGAFSVARAILAGRAGLSLQASDPVLTRTQLCDLATELGALPLAQRALLPLVPPKRADILPTALLTILAAMEFAGADSCTHSFYNLRFGIAAELLEKLRLPA